MGERARYRALGAYADSNAFEYDSRRFRSLRGRMTDGLEWSHLRRGLLALVSSGHEVNTVIDVPTGTGRMAERMSAQGFVVLGIDASEDMLRVAQSKGAASAYLLGRVESLPLSGDSSDVVVCVRLFGHLPPAAKIQALAEFHRVGRAGIVIQYPSDSLLLRIRRAIQARRGRVLENWYPVSRRNMRTILVSAGFDPLLDRALLWPVSETRVVVARRITK